MAKSNKRQRFTKRGFRLKLKKEAVFSISQIFFFALSALIVISFSRKGAILIGFNDLLVNYFSWSAIFLPFVFLSFGFLISKVKFILGQPNVIVGILLFFISIMSLGKAGIIGLTFWEAIAALVTGFGAGVILVGTAMVGLVILFNTSLVQVFNFVKDILSGSSHFIFGHKPLMVGQSLSRGGLKVSGGNSFTTNQGAQVKPQAGVSKPAEALTEQLVSNVPGEQKVWHYPPMDLLSEAEIGKAERGDIKGNAAVIEKTLESFGITARVVEVNLGPAVTQYAIEVALGTKLSKITSLERDMALALAAPNGTIRIEAPIPEEVWLE